MRCIVLAVALACLGLAACGPDETVHYQSCAEASAAGDSPLRRGDAGYRPALDQDGDGVACEVAS